MMGGLPWWVVAWCVCGFVGGVVAIVALGKAGEFGPECRAGSLKHWVMMTPLLLAAMAMYIAFGPWTLGIAFSVAYCDLCEKHISAQKPEKKSA